MLFILKHMFLSLLSFVAIPVFASENYNSVTTWINQSQCQKNHFLEDAKQLKKGAEKQVQNLISGMVADETKTCSGEVKPISNDAYKYDDKDILIFVSLLMPEESLKQLYQESESNGASLIIRGLKNNSFKETGEAIKDLGISVQIDPNLFEKYEIVAVPTFVSINKEEPLQIRGNVSLSYAKRKFEEAL